MLGDASIIVTESYVLSLLMGRVRTAQNHQVDSSEPFPEQINNENLPLTRIASAITLAMPRQPPTVAMTAMVMMVMMVMCEAEVRDHCIISQSTYKEV